MANALIHEKSPYLLQHAHNPVDWMPWGDAAFEKAKREDKPIFLSIGYSTCHWCHVMERESFENEDVAVLINREFVPIKVDREERPDVDRIYMLYVQASSGGGGWPMSVWLTPDLKPFFGGTYFPPDSRYGRPGFSEVLQHIARTWHENREKVVASSENIAEQLRNYASGPGKAGTPNAALFESGYSPFRRTFDSRHGGFGTAPKFPRPSIFNYLLRFYAKTKNKEALEMATQTLRAMAAGGMHDQLGGGFHRYSVDTHWFVPHFEKMLYDQAQLAISYLEAFQITRDPFFEQIARDIFAYVLRDMRHPEGGFYSAEDADSPDPENPSHKAEGAFYVWRQSEIEELLDRKTAAWFCHRYGVRPEGNVQEDPQGEFTGKNILYEAFTDEETGREYQTSAAELRGALNRAKSVLFEARAKRPRPHLDDKVLTAWNGLMVSAFAKGAQILGDAAYLDAAQRATNFIVGALYSPETGELLRRFRDGQAAVGGFLDDYAFFAQALLDLYETTFAPDLLALAVRFGREAFARFEDAENGGFFSTLPGAADLMLRMKDDYDGAEPSGNSVATCVLLRLAHLTGDDMFRVRAERSLRAAAPKLDEQPSQAPQMMVALGASLSEPEQVVVRCSSVDDRVRAFLLERRRRFEPYTVIAVVPDEAVKTLRTVAPFLASLSRTGDATLYECANFACQLPRPLSDAGQRSVAPA
jgi:uncharacterized protein YyaL (SSP411 family)